MSRVADTTATLRARTLISSMTDILTGPFATVRHKPRSRGHYNSVADSEPLLAIEEEPSPHSHPHADNKMNLNDGIFDFEDGYENDTDNEDDTDPPTRHPSISSSHFAALPVSNYPPRSRSTSEHVEIDSNASATEARTSTPPRGIHERILDGMAAEMAATKPETAAQADAKNAVGAAETTAPHETLDGPRRAQRAAGEQYRACVQHAALIELNASCPPAPGCKTDSLLDVGAGGSKTLPKAKKKKPFAPTAACESETHAADAAPPVQPESALDEPSPLSSANETAQAPPLWHVAAVAPSAAGAPLPRAKTARAVFWGRSSRATGAGEVGGSGRAAGRGSGLGLKGFVRERVRVLEGRERAREKEKEGKGAGWCRYRRLGE
ncbi:hypothetical protein MBLNU230_g2032t1 [Neophaeotheca triangularis]